MDRAAIKELFGRTEYSRRQYTEAIRPLGNDVVTKPAPGSGWPHCAMPLCTSTGRTSAGWLTDPGGTSAIEPEQVDSWEELEVYRRRVRGRARAYFDSLNDAVALDRARDARVRHPPEAPTVLLWAGVQWASVDAPRQARYNSELPDRQSRLTVSPDGIEVLHGNRRSSLIRRSSQSPA